MLRIGSKVKIISSQKIDGRFNYGKIVGVELLEALMSEVETLMSEVETLKRSKQC